MTILNLTLYADMLDEESSRVEALANGANDVIVVRRASGELQSTAWQGQIGKLNSVFQSREGRDVAIFVGRWADGDIVSHVSHVSHVSPLTSQPSVSRPGR